MAARQEVLLIDGGYGEGGGQILRTALSFAAITGRPVRIERVRAGRPKPGLSAQHLTAVRAVGALCGARVSGDALGSMTIDFEPRGAVSAGDYHFDVAAARAGGSAGAATLVLQAVLLPLALARGESRVTVRGGTHMAWSPSFDYARDVWLPALARAGVHAACELAAWGWFPAGNGEIRARISGRRGEAPGALEPIEIVERGALRRITGRAVAANLPAHIPQRMADRAQALLTETGVALEITALRVRSAGPGAGIFLTAQYDQLCCGFSALGVRGKPAELVAEEAVAELLAHRASGAALDVHLGDQIIVPLALASGESLFGVERVSRHLRTNAWVVERFGLARIRVEENPGGDALVTVVPQ